MTGRNKVCHSLLMWNCLEQWFPTCGPWTTTGLRAPLKWSAERLRNNRGYLYLALQNELVLEKKKWHWRTSCCSQETIWRLLFPVEAKPNNCIRNSFGIEISELPSGLANKARKCLLEHCCDETLKSKIKRHSIFEFWIQSSGPSAFSGYHQWFFWLSGKPLPWAPSFFR